MHVPDGVLPMEVCAGGYAAAGALTWASLRRIARLKNPEEGIPRASILAAAFFVASWVHVPVPPSSVHLVLNGLLGVLLGSYAFPAILVGLAMQAVMFSHGGLTTLGFNATAMGLGAIAASLVFGAARTGAGMPSRLRAFLAGAVGVLLSAGLVSVTLIATIPGYLDASAERVAVGAMMLAHIPVALVEGALTAGVVAFLLKVRPGILRAAH
ncbi:cobalt transporter CbiM [Candidatus Fermentibacterales bacterium]|nr:cobalt transporter CbiM [Candidatus Fermentibacterales bacterium]